MQYLDTYQRYGFIFSIIEITHKQVSIVCYDEQSSRAKTKRGPNENDHTIRFYSLYGPGNDL